MTEPPKRLAPTPEVLRELYLKSGNQCAIPGCHNLIMNQDGVVIGEVCHIEAALPGGPRFNPAQSNEDRRSYSNLLLLCHEHHKITDNEVAYPVSRLKEIKTDHESRFVNIEEKLLRTIVDYSTLSEPRLPESLAEMNDLFDWGHDAAHLRVCLAEIVEFIQRLKKLPIDTRNLLAIMAQRTHGTSWSSRGVAVHLPEIESATRLDPSYLVGQLKILQDYGILSEPDFDEEEGIAKAVLLNMKSGWPIWTDLVRFSELSYVPLATMVVDLDFSVLD